MNNLLNALRLEIAQLPKFLYFLSGLVMLVALVIYNFDYMVIDVSSSISSITNDYHYFNYGAIIAIVSVISYVVANIVGGRMMNRLYQKDHILEGFYSLPMSPFSRVAFIAIMLLIVAPLISIVPVLLVLAVVCGIEPFGIIAPGLADLFPDILVGILAYYMTLLIWVYPTITFRKRDGLIIFGLLLVFGIAFSALGEFDVPSDYLLRADVLTDPNVVGLIGESTNFSTAPSLIVKAANPFSTFLTVLIVILTFAAVSIGIVKKEA